AGGTTGSAPRYFRPLGPRPGGAMWAGGFRPDVEEMGAFRGHAAGVLDRSLRIEEAPAVGEAVRRHIEDAHDDRTAEAEKPRKQVGHPRRSIGAGLTR